MIYADLHTNRNAKSANEDWRKSTLGGRFMTECRANNWQPTDDIDAMVAAFHRLLRDYWTWDPGGKKSHSTYVADLLDGKSWAAECALAARAFMVVLKAPKPYGFAVLDTAAEIETYSGPDMKLVVGDEEPNLTGSQRPTEKPGFVSRHPTRGLFGLAPNIYDPTTSDRAPLYMWSNHKVVKFDGMFHDVCYKASYGLPSEMATAMICRLTQTTTTKDMDYSLFESEYKVLIKRHGKFSYFRAAKPGGAAANAGADYEGPLSTSVFGGTAVSEPIPLPALW